MSIIGTPRTIRGNMEPHPNWKLRGDIVAGQPVYIEEVPNIQKRVRRGPDGVDIWHKHHTTGEAIKPQLENYVPEDQPVIRREFVLVDLGNGIVQKNYHFAPSQADMDRRAQSINPVNVAELQRLVMEQQKQIQQLLAVSAGKVPDVEVISEDEEDFPWDDDEVLPTVDEMK